MAYTQTDSIITTNTKPDSIDIKYDRVYKVFVRQNNREINHLYKFNLVNIDLLTPGLTYEQKIYKSISIETYLYVSYRNLVFKEGDSSRFYATTQLYGSDLQCFSTGGYQMIKVYHNLKRRELLDKNTNGFSGNFFAFKLSGNYSWIDVFNQQAQDENINLDNRYYLIPGLAYGIQRRIGNIGYAELSLCLNYPLDIFANEGKNRWVLGLEKGITLKIGFAIESISQLRMMLEK
jgi:hypothetical protein